MYLRLHIQCPDMFVRFSQILDFLGVFSLSPQYQISEIRPMAAALIHSDIWTDLATVTRAFRDYANAPKNDGPRGDFKITYFIASVLCRIIQIFFMGR